MKSPMLFTGRINVDGWGAFTATVVVVSETPGVVTSWGRPAEAMPPQVNNPS